MKKAIQIGCAGTVLVHPGQIRSHERLLRRSAHRRTLLPSREALNQNIATEPSENATTVPTPIPTESSQGPRMKKKQPLCMKEVENTYRDHRHVDVRIEGPRRRNIGGRLTLTGLIGGAIGWVLNPLSTSFHSLSWARLLERPLGDCFSGRGNLGGNPSLMRAIFDADPEFQPHLSASTSGEKCTVCSRKMNRIPTSEPSQ
jgi:hypothetical protein